MLLAQSELSAPKEYPRALAVSLALLQPWAQLLAPPARSVQRLRLVRSALKAWLAARSVQRLRLVPGVCLAQKVLWALRYLGPRARWVQMAMWGHLALRVRWA